MKCLSSIWKLRKQSDRVKIILWLYLAACIFLFLGAKAGVEWIQVVRKPVTYRLLSEKSGQEENDPIKKIRNLPHVLAASHENKETITLTGNWGEMAVTCVELDADYMKLVYHISDKETMKTIYFNEKAYQKYKKTAKISKMQEQAEGGLQSQYYITDQERKAGRRNCPADFVEGNKCGIQAVFVYGKKSGEISERKGVCSSSV